eukprot:2769794-Prymnesium_polylepis.2
MPFASAQCGSSVHSRLLGSAAGGHVRPAGGRHVSVREAAEAEAGLEASRHVARLRQRGKVGARRPAHWLHGPLMQVRQEGAREVQPAVVQVGRPGLGAVLEASTGKVAAVDHVAVLRGDGVDALDEPGLAGEVASLLFDGVADGGVDDRVGAAGEDEHALALEV